MGCVRDCILVFRPEIQAKTTKSEQNERTMIIVIATDPY
jgi:hypothetical protein